MIILESNNREIKFSMWEGRKKMDVLERMRMLRIIEKIENNKKYAEKLGIVDHSSYAFHKEHKEEEN